MAWIESHQSLLTHRKTGRLARALGVSKITAIGHLHAFWWWCLDNAPDGVLMSAGRPTDVQDVSEGACWDGPPDVLFDALLHAGFVDRNDAVVTVHDWMEYAGRLIIRRAADAERKRIARQQQEHVQRTSKRRRADGVRTQPYPTQPNHNKEREKREATADAALPSLSLSLVKVNDQETAEADTTDPTDDRATERTLYEAWCTAVGRAPRTASERRSWIKALLELHHDIHLAPSGMSTVVRQYRAKFGDDKRPTPGQVAAIYTQLGVSPDVYTTRADGSVQSQRAPTSPAVVYPSDYAERVKALANAANAAHAQ